MTVGITEKSVSFTTDRKKLQADEGSSRRISKKLSRDFQQRNREMKGLNSFGLQIPTMVTDVDLTVYRAAYTSGSGGESAKRKVIHCDGSITDASE